jgi:hypothetical protein
MAQGKQDLLSRLADRGEQVVGRITDLPGAKTFLDRTTALTKNLDDLQKKVRGLDPLEKRVTALERRLAKLEGKSPTGTKKATTRRRTSPKPSASSQRTTRGRSSGSSPGS